jgi:hypothetical protein
MVSSVIMLDDLRSSFSKLVWMKILTVGMETHSSTNKQLFYVFTS